MWFQPKYRSPTLSPSSSVSSAGRSSSLGAPALRQPSSPSCDHQHSPPLQVSGSKVLTGGDVPLSIGSVGSEPLSGVDGVAASGVAVETDASSSGVGAISWLPASSAAITPRSVVALGLSSSLSL